jgi:hypothetical protein
MTMNKLIQSAKPWANRMNSISVSIKIIIVWVVYKPKKCISHSSGDWEVPDQSTSRFGVQ